MRALAFLATLAIASSAHAQFKLPDININRIIDTARNVGKAVREPSESEEIGIGNDVAARILGAAPLTADAGVQQYVNRVGRWLALQSERPDLPWHFGVLEAPQVNAFAVPGGTIFITRGLLARMTSEAELAGVLSHDIVHVVHKHHLKAIQKGAIASLSADAAGSALANMSSEARSKVISFGTEMYARGLDKSDEFEADRLGVVIAARGGYDAYGLPAVLQTLQAMNAADSALALMFKTHPAPGERLDALGRMQSLLDTYSTQPQLRERFVAETQVPR